MKKIIKFAGSQDEDARAFLRGIVSSQEYRHTEFKETLKTENPENCDTSLFKDDTELGVFEASRNPDAISPRYAIAKVCVSSRDFLNSQRLMQNMRLEEYKRTVTDARLQRAKEGMKKGHTVPIPVLEFKRNGVLNEFQEGRHRAVAAIEMNKNYMPIFIAKEV